MLWTARGLWLLYLLGAVMGWSIGIILAPPLAKKSSLKVAWYLSVAAAAFAGTAYLIAQAMGPAGGG